MSLWIKKRAKGTFPVLFPAVREGEENAVGATQKLPQVLTACAPPTIKVACADDVMEEPFNTQLLGCYVPGEEERKPNSIPQDHS